MKLRLLLLAMDGLNLVGLYGSRPWLWVAVRAYRIEDPGPEGAR